MTDNFASAKHCSATNYLSLYEQQDSYKLSDMNISHRTWNLAAEQRFWVQNGGNVGYGTLTELNILYDALRSKKKSCTGLEGCRRMRFPDF
jgi:hypothetical protein